MRAVNLIPEEERHNAGGAGGRSNGAVYLVLAALAVVVALVGVHSLLSARAADARAEAAALSTQADQAQARAAARQTAPTVSYATLRAKRVTAVSSLVASRFDWSAAMRQLAQVLPADVSLQQLTASASAGATSSSGGGSLRSAFDVPALELTGCAATQDEVASTMTDLQAMDGVTRVSLASSEAAEGGASSGASGDSASSGGDAAADSCGSRPSFSAVVFLTPPAGASGTTPTATP